MMKFLKEWNKALEDRLYDDFEKEQKILKKVRKVRKSKLIFIENGMRKKKVQKT